MEGLSFQRVELSRVERASRIHRSLKARTAVPHSSILGWSVYYAVKPVIWKSAKNRLRTIAAGIGSCGNLDTPFYFVEGGVTPRGCHIRVCTSLANITIPTRGLV